MRILGWKQVLFRQSMKGSFSSKVIQPMWCHTSAVANNKDKITVNNITCDTDSWTNVSDKLLGLTGRDLHLQKHHPLCLIKERIVNHFYEQFKNSRGNPLFSVHERLSPVVTVEQNFDSLLIPADHPSRKKSDTYYINKSILLRSHTSAHQVDLIRSGLDNFLVVGDVYRRDEIDASHYPAFHQMEGVRLCNINELVKRLDFQSCSGIFENGERTNSKQAVHTSEAVILMENEMKQCIEGMARALFGAETKWRWVETYFPFTHPSWELEIFYNEDWMEVLGCGIVEHKLLENAGVTNKIGWAFGFGLERLAMKLFYIPDVRLFWSRDSGFLSQFETDDVNATIVYKPISIYPQCFCDISFWIPEGFESRDFLDIARNVGSDVIEKITLVDSFVHPKNKRMSHCYRITYRHMERTLTQKEVNTIHQQIAETAKERLNIIIR